METFWINSRLFYQVHIQAPKHQDPLTLKHFRALWRAWIRWIHWRGPFHRALLTCTPLSTGPQKEPWQVTHWMVLSTVHIGRDRWIAQYNDTLGTLCAHTVDASVNNPACVRQERSSFIAKTNIVVFGFLTFGVLLLQFTPSVDKEIVEMTGEWSQAYCLHLEIESDYLWTIQSCLFIILQPSNWLR